MIWDTNWKVSPTMSLFTLKIGEYIPRIQHRDQQEIHMQYPILPDLFIKRKKIALAAQKARSIVQSLPSLLDQRPKSTQGLNQAENYPSTSTSKEFATTGNLLKFGLTLLVLSSLSLLLFSTLTSPKVKRCFIGLSF